MSEVRFVVREADMDWSGIVPGSEADYAIAALSADPATLAELEVAIGRYRKPVAGRSFFANRSPGICDEPHDAGLVIIDLAARLVVADSSYSSPELSGDVPYHNGHAETETWIRYSLADDWLFVEDWTTWREIAAERRAERAAHPPLDARRVFYGDPLLEFVAREMLAAHTDCESRSAEPEETIRKIHIAWMMTPREDLGGLCPREVAHSERERIMSDLQHQANRWSYLDECPPGLDESSFAFRYGGFGTHELVKYYDLVRELLWSARESLPERDRNQPAVDGPDALTLGDYLTNEIPRLRSIREMWFDTPDPDCHGRTPRSIINRERARIPEGVSGRDAIVDPDCPCCQMLAELPGPAFWHLDGCEMDDDFAFNLWCTTREEWEAEQRKHEEFNFRFNAEREERRRLGVAHSTEEPEGSIWSSSFSIGDNADVPLGIRLFGIGGHLAELIVGIRTGIDSASMPEAQRFIEQLNRDFGNLREILQSSEPQVAEALIEPVIDRFAETLAELASARTDLTSKCEQLTKSLAKFLLPKSPTTSGDEGDWEMPF